MRPPSATPIGGSPQSGRSASDPDQERGARHPAGASHPAVPACRSVRSAGPKLARTAGTAGRRACRNRTAPAELDRLAEDLDLLDREIAEEVIEDPSVKRLLT